MILFLLVSLTLVLTIDAFTGFLDTDVVLWLCVGWIFIAGVAVGAHV